MKKIDQLTSVRFFAAIIIVLQHMGGGGRVPELAPLASLTIYIVSFFFVLSGFVLTVVYYPEDRKASLWKFWAARISRIFPVYLFSFALTSVHYAEALGKMKWSEYLAAVFLLQAWFPKYAMTMNFPAWTLSVELFLYLVFPLVLYFARRVSSRRLIWISLGFWILVQGVRQFLLRHPAISDPEFLSYFPLFYFDSFLFGVAGGSWYLTEGRQRAYRPGWITTALIGSFVLIIVTRLVNISALWGLFNRSFLPLYVVFIISLALDQSKIAGVLQNRTLVALGDSSYAMYAIHAPLLWLFGDLLSALQIPPARWMWIAVCLPLIVVAAVACFKWVEDPAQRFLRKNPTVLTLVLFDAILLAFAAVLAYFSRIGFNLAAHERELAYSVRAGLPLALFSLILFRFYPPPQRVTVRWALTNLAAPLTIASILLWGALTVAKSAGWIASFPRAFLPLNLVLTFALLYLSRLALQRWAPPWATN